MKDTRIIYKPIGIIRSEHKLAEKTPIQPVYAKGCKFQCVIFYQTAEGLAYLVGLSLVYFLYQFYKLRETRFIVKLCLW